MGEHVLGGKGVIQREDGNGLALGIEALSNSKEERRVRPGLAHDIATAVGEQYNHIGR